MSTAKRFLVKRNSDLTEGRGSMVTVGVYDNLRDAVRAARNLGVMGVGDGEVYVHTMPDLHPVEGNYGKPIPSASEELVYGYHQVETRTGAHWSNGYVYEHPAVRAAGVTVPVEADPEYQEYLRLQKKFGEN